MFADWYRQLSFIVGYTPPNAQTRKLPGTFRVVFSHQQIFRWNVDTVRLFLEDLFESLPRARCPTGRNAIRL